MKKLHLFFLLALTTSCGVEKLKAREYLDYYSTHEADYSVKANFSSNSASLVYCPLDYILAESFMDSVPVKELKQLKTEEGKKSNTAFSLKLQFSRGSLLAQSKAPKDEQMKFYAVGFKHFIKAITSTNDTIPCSNYIFEANGNFGNTAQFNFEIPLKLTSISKIVIHNPYLSDSLIEFDANKYSNTTYPELKIK